MLRSKSITARRTLKVFVIVLLMLIVLFMVIAPKIGATSVLAAQDAWTYPFSKGMVGGAYMRLENTGGLSDSLIKITSDIAEASLHQTQIVNTIAHMESVSELEIPAHSTVDISPGGYHIMLEDLRRDLLEGESVQLRLFFVSGKQLIVDVSVGFPDDL